jgi:hypothetical protein
MTVQELGTYAFALELRALSPERWCRRSKRHQRWRVIPRGPTRSHNDNNLVVDNARGSRDRGFLNDRCSPLPRILHGWHGITR